jgi:hypothetical protein
MVQKPLDPVGRDFLPDQFPLKKNIVNQKVLNDLLRLEPVFQIISRKIL